MTDNDALVTDYLARLEAAASGLPAERRAELIDEIATHIAEARAQGSSSLATPESDLLDLLGRLGDPADIVRAASESDAPLLVGAGAAAAGLTVGLSKDGVAPTSTMAGAAPSGTEPGADAGQDPPPAADPGPWAARAGAGAARIAGPAGSPGTGPWPRLVWPSRSESGLGGVEIAAVILTIGSGFVFPFLHVAGAAGWLVGLVLLWYSSRWSTQDKVLATIVWPLGFGIAFVLAEVPRWYESGGFGYGDAGMLNQFYPAVRAAEILAVIAVAVIVAVRLLRRAGQVTA